MSLRIACDLDGTLADMDAALQREARRLFGPEVDLHALPGDRLESAEDVETHMVAAPEATSPSIASRRRLTPEEVRQLWQHVTQIDNFWMSLGEIEPGAVAALRNLTVRHRWEVLFLTQRPASAGETAQIQSQRWLQAHGFDLPSVMVMRGSRGKVAEALSLDVVLDDRPENCLDVVADSKARPILIWRLAKDQVPPGMPSLGVLPVFSISEALSRLEAMMAERARERTVFGRLRRAFGKTP